MASIKTNIGREKLAQAHSGTKPLPQITHIAFGSGGTMLIENKYAPKELTGAETTLFNEVIRKEPVKSFPDIYTARYSATIDADVDGLVGIDINEACLIDEEGDIVAIKTFTNKGLEEKTIIDFDYDAKF
ncbi:phage tail protein [Wukongibacter baidiensis]|uniref:phage tail-collar fiber domain-containing protein n=1 Tax=Wukongibacter baidiensis TaxID=1723361 RepID=UPI003D7F6F47